MSQLLQVATRGGQILALSGVTAPDYFDQGIPYISDEGVTKVAVEIAGIIDHYHQGLPYTAVGRLAVTNDKPVDYFGSGSAPFDVSNLLDFGSGPVEHHSAGIPYTVQGQISTERGGEISEEVQLVYDRMSNLDAREMAAIRGFVDGMVLEGVWADVFEFYAPCLNGVDFLTGFKTDTLVQSASPPTHVDGQYIDFINNSMHVLEGRNFNTYSQPNMLIGAYVVMYDPDTVNNSDIYGVDDGIGGEVLMRWRGDDTSDFNEHMGNTAAGGRTTAFLRPTGDFVGLGRIGSDIYNLQPNGIFFSSEQPSVVMPTGFPLQWHGQMVSGTPSAGNMADSRYSCMISMASPPVSAQGKVRNLILNFLIGIGVTGVPIP